MLFRSASAPTAVFETAASIAPERCCAYSGETRAGGVHVEHSETNGHVEAGVVVGERLRPNGQLKSP